MTTHALHANNGAEKSFVDSSISIRIISKILKKKYLKHICEHIFSSAIYTTQL